MTSAKQNILVTGASGFLGGQLAYSLSGKREEVIRATSRKPLALQMTRRNCQYIQGDLSSKDFCDLVTKDIGFIVHCAALSSPWGSYADFENANIIATDNLLKAAINNGVKRFIFISSPSIYADNTDKLNIKESDSLPPLGINFYAQTKLIAEQIVLSANNKGIETLSLRPRAIIGAGDTVIFPRLINAYKQNKLKIIGDGQLICDITCVKNVIYAIERALVTGEKALGLAYNITNDNPVKLWDVINHLLMELGLVPVSAKIPKKVAMAYAGFQEWKYIHFHKNKEPPLTKFGISSLSNSITLNIDRAKQLLDYHPVQTLEQGIDEFIKWYKQQNEL